ncbi:MAG TPA: FGLLP motif-containing membrane protein [Candidatus Limnocylindrales bacterium]|nr:FGLLP motif-containing membrane protein [Candidatus Limnocylindrales bacterium]
MDGGSARGLHPVVVAAIALALAVLGSIAGSPVAHADPPPTWTGPWLEANPDHGRVGDPFTAAYWYVTEGCSFDLVSWAWDGADQGTSKLDPSTCSATAAFDAAPTPEVGAHTVTATACQLDPSGGPPFCNSKTTARVTYTVDPTPTLTLKPAKGLATAGFSATYRTNSDGCGYTAAQFAWDGTPIEPATPLDTTTCSATLDLPSAPTPNDPGKHTLTAMACEGRACNPDLAASATYVVTPTPSPSPKTVPSATPRPTVTPAPTATPARTATPAPTATPTASAGTTASDGPSPTAIPSPTGGVLGETFRPASTSPPPAIAVIVPSGPPAAPPSGNPYVPAIVDYIGGAGDSPVDAGVIATNLWLTLLFMFVFALTAEIFNSTMDAHRDEIGGWWPRLARGPLLILRPVIATGAGLERLASSGRAGSLIQAFIVLALLGLIYGFLSPDFGLNPESVVLFVSLVIGLGFMTYFSEGSASFLAIRRYRARASVRLFGAAILVAIVAVILSRAVTLQPGLVYGFIASAVIVTPVALARRDDATLVLVPAVGLLLISVLAWLLLTPVRAAADADGSVLPALAETVLAMIVIAGLEGLVVAMIPLRFMDGAAVMGWSRVAWALTFGAVTFLWWQLLLNQDHAYASAFEQTNVQVVLVTLAFFLVTTGGLWSYFRFRPERSDAEEAEA